MSDDPRRRFPEASTVISPGPSASGPARPQTRPPLVEASTMIAPSPLEPPTGRSPRPAFISPASVIASIPRDTTHPSVRLPAPVEHDAHPRGRVYAVFGCKGGAGATTLAVNLASSLAGLPGGAAVVDLDTQLGDVMSALNLEGGASVVELATEAERLDSAALRRRMAQHQTGLYALSQGGRIEQLEALRPDLVPTLTSALARHFGSVVIDGIRDFTDMSVASLDAADVILMVLTEDVPAVRGAARCLELFRRLGYSNQKVMLVVNRHTPKSALTPAAISRTLGLPIGATVSNDYRLVQRAVDEGRLLRELSASSPILADVEMVAARISGDGQLMARAQSLSAKRSGGFFSSLFKSGGKRR